MNYYLVVTLTIVTSLFPAIVGWARFKKISPAYYPFLIWAWVSALAEVVNFVLAYLIKSNAVSTNIWQLIESLLILWQFKRWHLFEKKSTYTGLFIFFCLIWLFDIVFESKFYVGFNSYSRIIYSFILVLMSVHMINKILMRERNSLIRNPQFVICALIIVFFTYATIIETFYKFGLDISRQLSSYFYYIFTFISLVCNVIFGFVILWMPKRQPFSLQF